MSDNTRREAASTDLYHPARRSHPPQHFPPPGSGDWPDARTAEVLLSGSGSCTPPTEPADRLVRLLAAARDGRAPLDPAREAAALAAFRTAAAGRGRAPGRVRTAFTLRRPRMMAAAVVSALALGGVAVGMAAATRALGPGEGAGNGQDGSRPPAAVATDGSTTQPWTAAPGVRGSEPGSSPVHSGADDEHRSTGTRPGRGTGGTSGGFGRGGAYGFGQGQGFGQGHGTAQGFGQGMGQGQGFGQGRGCGPSGGRGQQGKQGKQGKQGQQGQQARKGEKTEKARAASGPRHFRPGRCPASRPSGR
ncbi:hypothetical protein [Actinacidiphila bryophytorum]|uniref:hypothetical protein n=1 Tax=Actinacidiphila bryophytorum TaxID=1436133 RepID=UPI002176C627|nr:hypothetical protein [Actinacidiphila bryophytorum]UWE12622.1 hypothetical protein NYE86_30685 [Actinacidiphila bryophytorum]